MGKCNDHFRIILDVGHTPELPGTLTARGRTEYEFNLNLAKQVRSTLLERGLVNVDLLLMRGGRDSLYERVNVANSTRPDLFISLHHDSVQPIYLHRWFVNGKKQEYSDRFSGYSLFVSKRNPYWRQALTFATLLGDQLLAHNMHITLHHAEPIAGEHRDLLDATRGIYSFDELIVLEGVQAPAVLLEAAVVVNRDEELVADSRPRRDLIANGIFNALEKYCATLGATSEH
jgi:N-acetylmuramoyl-L-alanine amidase